MPPLMDLHRIPMDFAAGAASQSCDGGRGDDPLWHDGNIAFGTLNVSILMRLLTFAVWDACGPRQ